VRRLAKPVRAAANEQLPMNSCRLQRRRAFAGLTPTRYLDVRGRFLREHPGHVMDGWPLPAD